MRFMIEGRIAKVFGIEPTPDKDHRRAPEAGRFNFPGNVAKRSAQNLLVRPADPVSDHHRAVSTVKGCQVAFDFARLRMER